jgi:hypothetical protein
MDTVLHQRSLLDGPLESLLLTPFKNRVFFVQEYGFHLIVLPSPLIAPTSTQGAHIPMVSTPESSLSPQNTTPEQSSGVIFFRTLSMPLSLLYEIRNTLCAIIGQVPDSFLNWLELTVWRFREMVLKPVLVSFLLSV